MALTYLSPTLQFDFTPPSLTPEEAAAYARRLHEVENALLCRAFGGRALLPGCREQLQRYLNGELSRAEAFQCLYESV